MTKPSKLWRKLGATQPLFVSISEPFGIRSDDSITDYTITHGTGNPAGLSVTAAEIGVTGSVPPSANANVIISMTDYGADLLAGLIGADPAGPTTARARFSGRVVGIDVNDRGDRRPDLRTTKLTASSWTSILSTLGWDVTIPSLWPDLPRIYQAFLDGDQMPGAANFTSHGVFPFTKWQQGDKVTADTVTGECMADIGVLFRSPRGVAAYEAWTVDARAAAGAALAADRAAPELLRRHCDSPVTWSIPIAIPKLVTWSIYWNDGTLHAGTAFPNIPGASYRWSSEELKLEDLVIDPNTFNMMRAMQARVNQSTPTRYSVDTLKIDLLRLLASDNPDDVATAGMLLRLDAGDPLKLGYDWPDEISGIVYASRITERLSPHSWTLEIDCHTSEQITGVASPAPAGDTWPTAWSQATTWDTIPAGQTWDTI